MICLQPKIFDDLSNVKSGFFGRQGGVSKGLFSSLNCGVGSGDDVNLVEQNRKIVSEFLQIPPVAKLYQVHSNICVSVDENENISKDADASVTTQSQQSLGILTADCGPVLFYGGGVNGPVVGAAHAGWGGAVKGVLESTIDKMILMGVEKNTIRAAIGPCIGWDSYEVSFGFEKPFLQEDQGAEIFFKVHHDKLKFYLAGYIAFRLKRAGIAQIEDVNVDTYEDEERWFSYRRSTHRSEPQYGRQLSVIALT